MAEKLSEDKAVCCVTASEPTVIGCSPDSDSRRLIITSSFMPVSERVQIIPSDFSFICFFNGAPCADQPRWTENGNYFSCELRLVNLERQISRRSRGPQPHAGV